MSSSLPFLLVMLFTHVEKRFSQMFFKTGALKYFARFRGKHLCFYLKEDSNTGVFLWILRNLKVQHFYRRPVHYTFTKFYLIIDNWDFRVIFYYFEIMPCNRKNFAVDRWKYLVKRWFFSNKISILLQRFFFVCFFFFFFFAV